MCSISNRCIIIRWGSIHSMTKIVYIECNNYISPHIFISLKYWNLQAKLLENTEDDNYDNVIFRFCQMLVFVLVFCMIYCHKKFKVREQKYTVHNRQQQIFIKYKWWTDMANKLGYFNPLFYHCISECWCVRANFSTAYVKQSNRRDISKKPKLSNKNYLRTK